MGKRIREGSVLLRLLYSCSSAGHALLIEGYAQTSTKLSRDPKVFLSPLDMFNFDEAAKACQ